MTDHPDADKQSEERKSMKLDLKKLTPEERAARIDKIYGPEQKVTSSVLGMNALLRLIDEDDPELDYRELVELSLIREQLEQITKNGIEWKNPKIGPLHTIKAKDIPRGLDAEDVATDC